MSAISPGRLRGEAARRACGAASRGFTFLELIVGLTLFGSVSLFLLQPFMHGIAYANRSDEKSAATSIAMQVMEQIKASPNPYTLVGFSSIARTNLPLPAPYAGVSNPTPHAFQAAVTVAPDNNLFLSTVTVTVYRPQDPDTAPLVTLATLLDAQ